MRDLDDEMLRLELAQLAIGIVQLVLGISLVWIARFLRRQHRTVRQHLAELELLNAAPAATAAACGAGMTDREKTNLTVLEQTYAAVDEEIGPQMARRMTDAMRADELAADLVLGRVMLRVVDGLHQAACVDPVLLTEPGYNATLAVIAHAALELTALYRETV